MLAAGLFFGAARTSASAAVTVLGVQYQQDNPYAEYNCWYHYGSYPASCGSSITGCNVHVFLKNTGGSPVTVNDVTLGGYSLKTILKRNTSFRDANSIFFYWDNPPQDVFDKGEPVWYRADPNPIPAGGVARVVVRLRSVPVIQPVSVGVVTSAGTVNTAVPVNAADPVLASVGFSSDRTRVYLHWRRAGGAAPTSIFMDGVDVTANATTVGDPTVNFAATVLQFPTPLANMSYHVYQGVYADGKTATGSLRTWVNRFIYGTWGVREIPDNDTAAARAWIDECNNRGVNAYVMNSSGGLQDFMATSAGRDYAEARDYGYVKDSNAWGTNPRMWFIDDEPDIEEGNIACGTGLRIPCGGGHTSGILGLHLLEYGESLRAINPSAPTTINLDGNFKPDGWYAYGQLADVMMMDSYYEQEMATNHWYHPERDPLYTKPTSIYAAAIATTTAAEPNPMHMILYSCEYKDLNLGYIWPFSTPASKRIQAYYALAGGAKGMAYWWFKRGYPFNGLDAGGPAAQALWKEIGLIGCEVKTAQPLLVISHPVTMATTATAGVWAKTLAVGADAMILLAVNDQFYNDWNGTHLTPVSNATATVTLPAWLRSAPSAFRIAASGLTDVPATLNGSQLQLTLGTLNVTQMIVVTTNPQLRATLQQRYDQLVRPGVCVFAPEQCVNNPPTITQHPSSQSVDPGATATLAVVAGGTGPLSYQWQKNGSNLSNGGHYSGVATATLTISSFDGNDVADYRCVVTNPYGTATSNAATLTLAVPGPPTITQHPASQTASIGSTATFTVLAVGTAPLAYQWQKSQANLSNGGHYAGVTTATLTISNADAADAGDYRCVVSNGYGSATSNEATLTITTCSTPVLINGDFEGGNTGGVGNGWIAYQRDPAPTTVWTIQTASPPTGGGLQYQQIANTSSTGGGGVRQDITNCSPGATYTISGWMRTNSASATCTVKCSPTASTNWATAIDLTPPQSTTSSTWIPFSGTIVAAGTSMTIWLDGQTGGTGLNKAACFDSVTVTGCTVSSGPTITEHPAAQSVCAGGSATFSVTASGEGMLVYQWQKNGTDLADGGRYAGVTTTMLIVSGVEAADAADYRCVVSNAGGSTTSNAAALTLKSATQITQHPSALNACTGATATFTVAAIGDGTLSYQWQKNGVNLANGGHYSGVTTATLSVTNADAGDSGTYRCVVTGGCGAVVSNGAALNVAPCDQPCPVNTGFENGFTAGAGNGWTKFVKTGSEGPYLAFSDETVEKNTGSHSQEVYSHNVGYDGGVYQQFSAAPGATYTASAWFKCYCPEAPTQQVGEGWLGIDPTGGTDPNSPNIWWGSAPGLSWAQKSYTFTAQSNTITMFLRGRSTKTPDKGRSAYVWIDDARVVLSAPTDAAAVALSPTVIRWKWNDLMIETGYRVKDPSGTDLSGLLPANVTQWDETTGISPNTQYTRHIHAVNVCGDSGPSTGQTRYSMIQTPGGVTIGTITTDSIVATPTGPLANLAIAGSGVCIFNTTAGTNSGWSQSLSAWTSDGLAANTRYSLVARARNGDGVETADSALVSKWTLSIPPAAGSIAASTASPCMNAPVLWTAAGGFGAGAVQYYRWAWDQTPTHVWTGTEPHWSSGTLETTATVPGTWYLHVQGCNGENVANGAYDYAVTARTATVVTQPPSSMQVPAGATVSFTVAAVGDGPLAYQWQRNGETLADDGHCAGTATATLTIFGVTPADAAGYRCVVTGGCGVATSNVAFLTVATVPQDADADGDVDGADFGIFAGCFNGAGNPVTAECLWADLDADSDVDGSDFGLFSSCFNGTGNQPVCG